MARDLDARRGADADDDDLQEQSLESLKAQRLGAAADLGDDVDALEVELDLPDAEVRDEELALRVLPRQADEFTCTSCFLVHHRSQLADARRTVCTDCAA
ncbi:MULTISPECIES: DUF4193 family protein [Pseudofrankia]|jgi:hypothetical protein|uniref:DUF4193 family protein n=1 Tax=Pseudofrankia TaxID=2994363 RepID=UPI000234BD7C|nr:MULTISPECIES: DUF4193 family protein [Pseudofrankia]OHV38067.1 dUTPase [Pseudofrankia sp. EUN1h]